MGVSIGSLTKRSTSYGYSSRVAMDEFFAEQRKREKAQNWARECEKRKERLLNFMEVFERDFEPQFPEIASVIKSTLFVQWANQKYTKEIPQASLQIEGCIRGSNLPNAEAALSEWKTLYKHYQLIEEMKKWGK